MTCVRSGNATITVPDETENTADLDLRTRAGREEEVRRQVREHGGFTVFWGTENQKRAQAIDRLIDRGELRPAVEAPFPWCAYYLDIEVLHG